AGSVHVTQPILWTAPAYDFMGFVTGLAKGTFVPVQNAPAQVHDVHAVAYVVQQRFIDVRVDRSHSPRYLKSRPQKKGGGFPKAVKSLVAENSPGHIGIMRSAQESMTGVNWVRRVLSANVVGLL